MQAQQSTLRLLMLPWVAHGHASPFLELAKKLSRHNFIVYFCSTPAVLSSLKHLVDEGSSSTVHFIELDLPVLPNLPPHLHTTKSLPPHLMPHLKRALDLAEPTFCSVLHLVAPDLLVYDFAQPWAAAAAASLHIPSVLFLTMGASALCTMCHHVYREEFEFPFPDIQVQKQELLKVSQRVAQPRLADVQSDLERFNKCLLYSSDFIAVNTFREIEAKQLDYLPELLQKEVIPIGAVVHSPLSGDGQPNEFQTWLDSKKRASTVFVSFGSESYLSNEEIAEVARSLEATDVNFIWVIRFPDGKKTSLRVALPGGFLERVGTRGLVVEDWAPQTLILAHSSVGGFITHCGWNSLLEGMWFGVPLIPLPLQLDQPMNAAFAAAAGVAVEIRRETGVTRFSWRAMAAAILEVMQDGDVNAVRKKAEAIAHSIRRSGDQGVDAFAQRLRELCRSGCRPNS